VYAAPQVYAAPPVTTGYYSAPVVSQPIYAYAPGYGYGSYASGYQGYGYGSSGSYGYPASGYGSYYGSAGYPGYGGYGYRPGYRAARRVAIHNARWH
jgi:hypothetical protein